MPCLGQGTLHLQEAASKHFPDKQFPRRCEMSRSPGQMDARDRRNIRAGLEVLIVLKKDQRTGDLTRGIVKNILTKSRTHPHGIKVRLTDGQVGRVKELTE